MSVRRDRIELRDAIRRLLGTLDGIDVEGDMAGLAITADRLEELARQHRDMVAIPRHGSDAALPLRELERLRADLIKIRKDSEKLSAERVSSHGIPGLAADLARKVKS